MKKIENVIEFGNAIPILKRWRKLGVTAQCVVTSPPYWLQRIYSDDNPNEIGREPTPELYVSKMVELFSAVKDILKEDGVVFLNLGDTYLNSGLVRKKVSNKKTAVKHTSNIKPKNLAGIPWMVAFALRDLGFILRQEIIWSKPNPMPESVVDRFTKSHETIFLFSKNPNYFFDSTAVKEETFTQHDYIIDTSRSKMNRTPGKTKSGGLTRNNYTEKNKRSVWTIPTKPYLGSHFAVFPEELVTPCILSATKKGDVVLDPFMGSGTTAKVAKHYGRKYLGCELNEDCRALQEERINGRSSKR